jgi:CMP-N,N'-diacetyllegionaminic acid synthase|tara:strand:+ start:9903 stop:10817 length:915 start_codon:yes stop_codon:yes gene_type:complete
MQKKTLVIGYGSIGKRHAEILDEMDEISLVAIFSSQFDLPYDTLSALQDIPDFDPDYVVVGSPTNKHYSQLMFLEENLKEKKFLVEKPLFEAFHDYEIKNNEVYVGYNLRFHPLLNKVKELISVRKLWNIQVFCGSYLPDWRPGRDYRETTSAKTDSGGGVLLDLSHELDYVQWLTGAIDLKYCVSEKISDLNIETDDFLHLSGKSASGANVHLVLNYFTRQPLRQILIDGEGISIQADLIANTLSVVQESESSNFAWPEFERNDTYLAQHQAILEDEKTCLCTYAEGLETMRLIDRIRSFGNS